MTHTLEHHTNHNHPSTPETQEVSAEDAEVFEKDRMRIIGEAILSRTITLDTRDDSAIKQPLTPIEKIPRTPESFVS
jgi:hypothetical protein